MTVAPSQLRRMGATVVVDLPGEVLSAAMLTDGAAVLVRGERGLIQVVPAERPDDDLAVFATRFTRQYRDDLAAL